MKKSEYNIKDYMAAASPIETNCRLAAIEDTLNKIYYFLQDMYNG